MAFNERSLRILTYKQRYCNELDKKEGMPAHQKGRLWRFDVNEVDEWMKNNGHKNISDAKEFLD